MNLQDAKEIITKLSPYKGRVMQPFNCPVKDFVILPAGQKEFDEMLKAMATYNLGLEQALAPYQNDVNIIIYFDVQGDANTLKHCDISHFLKSNGLDAGNL
jgi:hypothetical protein